MRETKWKIMPRATAGRASRDSRLLRRLNSTEYENTIRELVGTKVRVKELLPEEDQMFVTEIEGKNVWVIEDGQAITMMYPEDY